MRKQFLAILMTALLTNQLAVAGPAAADIAAGADHAATRANLQHVQVAGTAEGLQVELTASEPIVPKVTTLAGPPRLVLDLPHTALAVSQRRINVDHDGVKAIRMGDTAVATRVVIDLLETRDYTVTADGNRLFVTFKGTSSDAKGAAAATSSLEPSREPVASTKSPFAAKLMPVAMKSTSVPMPVKTVAVKKADLKVEAKAEVKTAEAKHADIAPDTVFMEPIGQTQVASKVEDTPAPVRALDAAAKFAEKPLTA